MNKLLIFLFSILFIGCCNEKKVLNNGLTKKATKSTVYFIRIKKDSLNKEVKDTLAIRENKYNLNDQISKLIQRTLIDNEKMEIDYIYNNFGKIKTEIVKMSNDNSNNTVDYFYKDTLLIKTLSETKNDIFRFKQIGEYEYNSENTLKQSTLLQQYIDSESNDTITNTFEISKYDNKELVTKSELHNYKEPKRNRTSKYEYDCGILMKIREFNSKDSLISNTEFKYEFDKFENWIKKELFINKELNFIQTREIEYK
ncbi:hypothetical protein [Winogradskyella psychrotolerans]|uniref:hypothetical protein n=1 Tax=Winogradskyella psychrotolerans TaxID=1344585 RepID=UPI001C0658B7|nr:hypothetical protein [Winogradskyella psychrotolerans]MBU2928333.1 hypothetical protein [Winogradskyella psychrotolerans]